MGYYWPEGMLLETEENRYYLQNEETLQSAMRIGQILEGRALLCDYDHNLVVDMGCCRGIIPREEGALGIKEQTVRDIAIISRVNKSVCFLITAIEHDEAGAPRPILSRRAAQLRCLSRGALILDLASRPGGTDFAAARELGLRAEHALSLPARGAPETAGALVAHTVEVILQERAATARSERGVS